MSELVVANFGGGLDARKFFLSLPPGTLTKLVNAHITSGAEIEKRLAFIQDAFTNGTGYAFGLQPTPAGIMVFGSAGFPVTSVTTQSATTVSGTGTLPGGITAANLSNMPFPDMNGNVAVTGVIGNYTAQVTWAPTPSESVTGLAANGILLPVALPAGVIYQYLADPTGTGLHMTGVVSSDLFGGKAFVAAQFSDGNTYCFYNGVLVEDFLAGLVTSWSDTDDEIATALVGLINATVSKTGLSLEYEGQILSSGNQLTITSTPTLASDAPFTTAVVTNLQSGSTGTITPLFQSSGTPESPATGATASMSIVAGTVGPRANALLNGSASTNVTATNTITIGAITYTFVSSLTSAPAYSVLIAGSGNTDTSFANLVLAINGTGTPGTQYSTGTAAHPQVTSGNVTAHNVTVTAIQSGTAGNSIAVGTSPSSIAGVTHPWTFSSSPTTTLQGGLNTNQITQISAGLTNLLSNPVQFDTNVNQTAQDIATAINSNTGSGFTAVAAPAQSGIVITAPASTGAGYNGTPLIITAAGDVCCAFCSFTIVAMSGVQTIGPIEVNGSVDLLQSSTVAFDTSTAQTASDVATAINSHTGTTNYLACAVGSAVYISPTVLNTSSAAPSIVVTSTATTLAATASSGLVASVTPSVVNTTFSGFGSFNSSPPFSCVVSGGVPPYSYSWSISPKFTGTQPAHISTPLAAATTISGSIPNPAYSVIGSFALTCSVTDSATPTPNTASASATWNANIG